VAALATRRRLVAELGATGARFVASHIPGPHAMRIDDGTGEAVVAETPGRLT